MDLNLYIYCSNLTIQKKNYFFFPGQHYYYIIIVILLYPGQHYTAEGNFYEGIYEPRPIKVPLEAGDRIVKVSVLEL